MARYTEAVSRVSISLAIGSAALAMAQEGTPEVAAPQDVESAAKTDTKARAVLDRVRTHYAGVDGLGLTVAMSSTMTIEGEETTHEQPALSVLAQRPNRTALRMADDTGEYALVCDGERIWQYAGEPLNAFTDEDAPASFAGVIKVASLDMDDDPSSLLMMPHTLTLALLDGGRFDKIVDSAAEVQYIGEEERDGRSHDRIRFIMEEIDADVWVHAGDEAWIARIEPDMSKMFAGMQGMGDFSPPKTVITFDDWTRRADFEADAFAFEPPEGAKKVASLMEAAEEQWGDIQADEGSGHAHLLGKAAPELGLDLLGGGKVSLATHKEKEQVVVLDFWATWCAPCVRGLPLVSGAAKEFGDNVAFYAVNQREGDEVIKAFLKKRDLDIAVPLDRDGKAGDRYGVSGIPQTVIIGKDGTVQAVHVGFMPGMEDDLRDEIRALLDGKTLAETDESE